MTTDSQTLKPWGRGRLLITLAGVIVTAIALLVGFVLAIHSLITKPTETPSAAASTLPGDRAARRDMLAAGPMLQVTSADSTQGVPAARPGPRIEIPNSTLIGAAKVPSGFPQTPQGAIGQLAAIEVAVLSQMSIARTNEIHQAWTAPGAPSVEEWRMTRNVQSFLAAASMGQSLERGARVDVTPVAAQTKASDGDDWTIACVLVDVRVYVRTEARMAYGYCERMSWDGDRWLIAEGMPPAEAPSTWPGTDLAFEAGWRSWPDSDW